MSTENLRKIFMKRGPKEHLRKNLQKVLRNHSPKEWAWLCLDTEDQPQKVHPAWGRRIGQWDFEVPADGLPGDERVGGTRVPLAYALLRMNRAPANHRYPVLFQDHDAVVRLVDWLTEKNASYTIPIVRVRTERGPSADFSTWACWLDAAQADAVRRVFRDSLSGAPKSARKPGTLVTLPSGEQLTLPSAEEFAQGSVDGRYDYVPTQWIPPREASRELTELTKNALDVREGYKWQVMASRDDRDRTRQTNVWIDRASAVAAHIEKPELVAVWSALYHGWRGRHIAVLARCTIVDDLGTAQSDQKEVPYLQADQIVREAIGVEIGEKVVITSCRTGAVPFLSRLLNYMLGKPSYVTCRVQTADTSSIERECCLVDELTLGLLGVESGDTVVIEAVPRKAVPLDADPGNRDADRSKVSSKQLPVLVRCLRVKAFKISDEALRQRSRLVGGDLTSRFPSSRDSLGVFPDLPWIFLDKSARLFLDLADQELGADQKLGVVRVRASRRYQGLKEARAMLIVVAVASITVLAIFKTPTPQWLAVGVLFTLLTWLILWSLHDRLTRVFRKWPKR
jgi:hypothetical protein